MLGATASGALQQEALVALRVGDAVEMGRWRAELQDVRPVAGPNWTAIEARIDVRRDGAPVALLTPQSRMFVAPAQETTESSRAGWRTGELYAVLGKPDGTGKWQVHLWFKPLVRLIWWGGMLMALGGMVALGGRVRSLKQSRAPRLSPLPVPQAA
jgi:cytochrome c-type biogenesis protein CcmF